MASEPPPDDTVISFGEPTRRSVLRDLGTDRRLPMLTASLAAVAAFGSLISEWQTTTVNEAVINSEGATGSRVLTTGLIDLGAPGAGYLAGLLVMTTAIVLVLFGPAAGKGHARLAGFAAGGVLLALLLALVGPLGDFSLLIPRYFTMEVSGEEIRVAHGRGLWCAIAAVGLGLIALQLPAATTTDDVRPAAPARKVEAPDEPLDLTISPATPFASHPGDLDQPHRS
ncbi:hypothetical protein [Actinoplanes utahensis]|uniref:hypothetical protein n=1 Tax=Actinoplanes utahensis TaxID=1869 RepID=UPI000ACA2177|nr:hypothetical protein [Actinoplanes utahensis]GIF31066.1 hypothetical protein Aut01nite_40520 [Actinoplanes utahensis]